MRSIIEDIMTDIMFEIPSDKRIEKCIITKETVTETKNPEIIINENKDTNQKENIKIAKTKSNKASA